MITKDDFACDIAVRKFGLPRCLHVPIAARNEAAIHAHIGQVLEIIAPGQTPMALLVETPPPESMDVDLPIWKVEGVTNLFRSPQLWVHVDFKYYRRAYTKAFPSEAVTGMDIDHVLNRHVARVKNFSYVRLIAISKGANRSSGGLSEKWAIDHHSSERMRAINLSSPAQIQYADLADIVKMLDLKTGGALQDLVNEAQELVRPLTR